MRPPLCAVGDRAVAAAVDDDAEGQAQEVVLAGEVVGDDAGRHPRLGGDAADGGGLEAVAGDDPPHRGGDLGTALLVVDDPWHLVCYLIL